MKPKTNLWDNTFVKRRDEQRAEMAQAPLILSFEDIPWEINQQGKMRWYLHPSKHPQLFNTIISYVQEIPPKSRSGKVFSQGCMAFYVWKGRGYTILNGKRHDWEQEDLIVLPFVTEGLTWQHFNADDTRPALLLAWTLNLVEAMGVDMGVGFEQLENCPEYDAAQKKG